MKKIITLFVLCGVFAGNANALIEVNALGGVTLGKPMLDPSAGTDNAAQTAVTYGATIAFGMLPMFALETGIFSVGHKYKNNTSSEETSWRGLEIPVMLRFNLIPMMDFGFGGYYEKHGNFTEVLGPVTSANQTWGASNFSDTDHGLKAGVRFKFPILPLMSVLVDGSYKMGLKDRNNSTTDSWKTADLNFLGGLGIGF